MIYLYCYGSECKFIYQHNYFLSKRSDRFSENLFYSVDIDIHINNIRVPSLLCLEELIHRLREIPVNLNFRYHSKWLRPFATFTLSKALANPAHFRLGPRRCLPLILGPHMFVLYGLWQCGRIHLTCSWDRPSSFGRFGCGLSSKEVVFFLICWLVMLAVRSNILNESLYLTYRPQSIAIVEKKT